jgi:hypothetical protein
MSQELAKAKDVAESDELHTIVVASNREQMQVAQQQLVAWTEGRIARLRDELTNAEALLESARSHKWKISGYQAQVRKTKSKIDFYDKLKAAVELGYTIIPNFDGIDVFAIRTNRHRPKQNFTKQNEIHGPVIPVDQVSECPQLGDGGWVSATAKYEQDRVQDGFDKNQKPIFVQQAWATKHDDIDFPFKLVKPEILDSTRRAMKAMCFDDIGVYPARKRARRGDPMVIGRIHLGSYKYGQYQKTISFLITWFIDTKAL